MDCASPLLELVNKLWGLASKPLGYICNLKDSVDAFRNATGDLEAMSGDVKERVEREEGEGGGGVRRTNQVAEWLRKVQEFEGRVHDVRQETEVRDRIKCLCRCLPWNCWSSYKLGKRVDQLLNEARELQHKRGEFSNLTSLLPPPPVLAMPMDETVGLDITFNKVWKWLVDEQQIGMYGLYGAGGVGKTTLMKRINNELLRANHGFKVVWVVVSKQVNEDNIRDAIRKGLNIKDEIWEGWSQVERVHHLLEVLTEKKFVLLIDDVWARLDLSKIGVPRPSLENGSKIVFTTRSKEVCNQMGAKEACEVHCLTSEEALKLFEKNINKSLVDCDQEIQDLAKDIAKECKGLPLALVTVGRALAGRDDPSEWRHALTTLRNKPHKLPGMVGEVYHILEFSYDSLDDPTRQACFLYCCLFPEDYPIIMDELIDLWIGEGLLGDTDDVYHMRDEGASILGDLKRACLLESGLHSDDGQPTVKMHDVIRDMATWIARDHGQKENKLLVIEKEEDMSANMISKWGEAGKVSLWGKWIQNIDQAPPRCSLLKTLIVRKTNVRLVPRGFFNSMTSCLTVLDLSNNRNIELFPEEICDLVNLQYLNMFGTLVKELPREIKNLTRLRWLLLGDLHMTFLIPIGAIASLPLNVFRMGRMDLEKEEEIVEELERMQDLSDLSITVRKSSSALKIFQFLQRCIRRVEIRDCKDLTHIPISHSLKGNSNFSHFEVLRLRSCPMLVKMEITQGIRRAPNCPCFPSLVEVSVESCGLSNLAWLVHAPNLRRLTVEHCDSMEKMIGDGIAREELAASGLFSRLEVLYISYLPKLRSICDHTLFFPQGVKFVIWECPGLRKLPLDSNSARGSFSISGDEYWWAKFKFEWDPAARVTFQHYTVQTRIVRPRLAPDTVEEMTWEEATRKAKNPYMDWATIIFRPRGPSE